MLSVFTVSAAVHEYVLSICFGFFYPVLFCLFMCFGSKFPGESEWAVGFVGFVWLVGLFLNRHGLAFC